jgi:hypothetical protein
MHAASPLSLTILRVNNFNSATFEIVNIAGRKLSSSHFGQCCCLRIPPLISAASARRAAPILANSIGTS